MSVNGSDVTSGINAALGVQGEISGTVDEAAGGHAALAGVEVFVLGPGGVTVGAAKTEASGRYTVPGLAAGTYEVEFLDGKSFAAQFYSGAQSLAEAKPVKVASATDVTGVNALMSAPGAISGVVTAATGGANLAGVTVEVLNERLEAEGSAVTEADGAYKVTGLAQGNYVVVFTPSGGVYAQQYYDESSSLAGAAPVQVLNGQTTGAVNGILPSGGTIDGRATEAASGDGLANVDVEVYDSNQNLIATSITDSEGIFTVTGLEAGGTRSASPTPRAVTSRSTKRAAP